jgi:hypothetical protein
VINGTRLAALVANGNVRYVLWGGGGQGSNTSITSYLQTACTVVNNASLGTGTNTANAGGFGGGPGASGAFLWLMGCLI